MFDFENIVLHNKIVFFEDDEYEKIMKKLNGFCKKLSSDGQSHSYYKDKRNAATPEHDNIIGKLAELAAAKYFQEEGFPKMSVDFSIRKGRKKGWVCDLPYKEKDESLPNCHVKACSSKARKMLLKIGEEYSWTFQYKAYGYGGKDVLFTDEYPDDLIVMAYVPDVEFKNVEIIATAPWNKIKDLMKPPLKKTLQNQKKCVYYKDLLELKED